MLFREISNRRTAGWLSALALCLIAWVVTPSRVGAVQVADDDVRAGSPTDGACAVFSGSLFDSEACGSIDADALADVVAATARLGMNPAAAMHVREGDAKYLVLVYDMSLGGSSFPAPSIGAKPAAGRELSTLRATPAEKADSDSAAYWWGYVVVDAVVIGGVILFVRSLVRRRRLRPTPHDDGAERWRQEPWPPPEQRRSPELERIQASTLPDGRILQNGFRRRSGWEPPSRS